MRRWDFWTLCLLALSLGAVGCSGNNNAASTITVQISPNPISIILNQTQPFVPLVTGSTDQVVTWSVSCASGVTSCGSIDMTTGVYTAPSSVPSTPTATITATAHANSSSTGTATVTIISGITIAINNQTTNVTIGTNETFTFSATVNNPGCNVTAAPTCRDVTWSVPTTAGVGTIDTINPTDPTVPRTGLYHAPATAPSPGTVTVTATSVADTTVTANTTVTIVTAVDPTLSSVSPNTAALGSIFLDAFITGTNFISTDRVFINDTPVAPADVFEVSNTMLRVRITADKLAPPPPSSPPPSGSVFLKITASQLNGSAQHCTPECLIAVNNVRPGVIGPSPDSIPQGTPSPLSFNVNGGFFGTSSASAVTATYDGQARTAQPHAVTDVTAVPPDAALARQVSVTIGGGSNPSDFGVPGLHQVAIQNIADSTKYSATNLAVQPNFSISSIGTQTLLSVGGIASSQTCPSVTPLGSHPSDVAVNPAAGLAVVANQCSNDITVIDLKPATPTVLFQSVCTAAVGSVSGTTTACPNSGPKSVTVATVQVGNATRNLALVANSTSSSVAVVDLGLLNAPPAATVTAVIPTQDPPAGVGINPVNGRALVSINSRGYGVLLDLTQTSPAMIGVVTISTGPNSHVAVEPHLNWAIATPGVVGSLGIVDLNRQTSNTITSVSRSAGIVTVNVQSSLAVQPLDAVLVQGVSDSSFNGIFTVNVVGPGPNTFSYTQTNDSSHPDVKLFTTPGTVNYAQPVATFTVTAAIQGVGVNPETQKAVLLDPSASGNVTFLSLLDQTTTSLQQSSANFAKVGNVAGAFNPLTNVAVVVNQSPTTNNIAVIDPTTPAVLTAFPSSGTTPVAVAVDPGTNMAVVVNQGSNNVSIFSLGTIRPLSIVETSPKTLIAVSSLCPSPSCASTAPSPLPQLTIIGKGFTSSSVPRLDGIQLQIIPPVTDRQITASLGGLPSSLLTHARRFALDVQDTASGLISNATDFSVIQQVDVSGNGCTTTPSPTGVAVDSQQGLQGLAVVSLFGCNTVALIDLNTGTGNTVAVGANPLGVAVLTSLHKAVVANNGSASASVVDELQQTVTNTITTGSGPMGVATDEATGEAAVANSVANTATVINLATAGTSSITTGQRPIALAFNHTNHQLGVANSGSNSASFGDAGGTSLGTSFSISLPTSVIYDPVANNFLVNSSTTNTLQIIDPTTSQARSFRIGINPTALAYNYLTSTLISTNTLSHTLTVVDFLSNLVRAVLPLPAAPTVSTVALNGSLQFGVDIQPRLNLAVVADTANGKVLFVPLPH